MVLNEQLGTHWSLETFVNVTLNTHTPVLNRLVWEYPSSMFFDQVRPTSNCHKNSVNKLHKMWHPTPDFCQIKLKAINCPHMIIPQVWFVTIVLSSFSSNSWTMKHHPRIKAARVDRHCDLVQPTQAIKTSSRLCTTSTSAVEALKGILNKQVETCSPSPMSLDYILSIKAR